MDKTKVVITVEGGVVQSVWASNKEVEIIVVDCDDLKAEGKSSAEIDGEWKRSAVGCLSVY